MSPLPPTLTVLATLLGATPAVSPEVHSCSGAARIPVHSGSPAARAAILCLLNERRAAHGLGPLHSNPRLVRAAGGHARDMVVHRYFAHRSRNGRPFDWRIRATGYMTNVAHWSVGENLAWGASRRATPRRIVASWMGSPPHRANILDRRFTEIGVAVVRGAPIARRTGPAATYATEFGVRD